MFLDQTEARRAEKKHFWRPTPALSKGLDDRPPPLYLKVWTSTAYHAKTVIGSILEPGHITFHRVTTATITKLVPIGDRPVLGDSVNVIQSGQVTVPCLHKRFIDHTAGVERPLKLVCFRLTPEITNRVSMMTKKKRYFFLKSIYSAVA